MDEQFDLGSATERAVSDLVDSGRYPSREDLLREGVRLVQARERALAELDSAIERGLADVDAGRVRPLEDVAAELIERYRNWPRKTG